MRTPTKPWYRASKDAWYVEFNGKQVRLAKGQDNEKAARDAFYKLMANGSCKLPDAPLWPTLSTSYAPLMEGPLCEHFCIDVVQGRHLRSAWRAPPRCPDSIKNAASLLFLHIPEPDRCMPLARGKGGPVRTEDEGDDRGAVAAQFAGLLARFEIDEADVVAFVGEGEFLAAIEKRDGVYAEDAGRFEFADFLAGLDVPELGATDVAAQFACAGGDPFAIGAERDALDGGLARRPGRDLLPFDSVPELDLPGLVAADDQFAFRAVIDGAHTVGVPVEHEFFLLAGQVENADRVVAKEAAAYGKCILIGAKTEAERREGELDRVNQLEVGGVPELHLSVMAYREERLAVAGQLKAGGTATMRRHVR